MEGVDPQVVQAAREGKYAVDPREVADAIVRRGGPQLPGVLKALERDIAPGEVTEDDPGTFPDAA